MKNEKTQRIRELEQSIRKLLLDDLEYSIVKKLHYTSSKIMDYKNYMDALQVAGMVDYQGYDEDKDI
jgi:hypothetical protein